jgi:hypothetical protein
LRSSGDPAILPPYSPADPVFGLIVIRVPISLALNTSLEKRMTIRQYVGVLVIVLGLGGAAFGGYELVVHGKIGGASERSRRNLGVWVVPIICLPIGWSLIRNRFILLSGPAAPNVGIQGGEALYDDVRKRFKRGDRLRFRCKMGKDCLIKVRVLLHGCVLDPDAPDAVPAEKLTKDFLANKNGALAKYLPDGESSELVVEGELWEFGDLYTIVLFGHRG